MIKEIDNEIYKILYGSQDFLIVAITDSNIVEHIKDDYIDNVRQNKKSYLLHNEKDKRKDFKWAIYGNKGKVIEINDLKYSYFINENRAIKVHKNELKEYPNSKFELIYYRVSIDRYLEVIHELHRSINSSNLVFSLQSFFSFEINHPQNNKIEKDTSMRSLHNDLLFHYKLNIDEKDYYQDTYRLLCSIAAKYYNLPWVKSKFYGDMILHSHELDQKVYDDIFERVAKLGVPYQISFCHKI